MEASQEVESCRRCSTAAVWTCACEDKALDCALPSTMARVCHSFFERSARQNLLRVLARRLGERSWRWLEPNVRRVWLKKVTARL